MIKRGLGLAGGSRLQRPQRSKVFRKHKGPHRKDGSGHGKLVTFVRKWKGKTTRNTRLLLGLQGPKRQTLDRKCPPIATATTPGDPQ